MRDRAGCGSARSSGGPSRAFVRELPLLLAEMVEDLVASVGFHLAHHSEQFAESTLREAFVREPEEILQRQVVDLFSGRREVGGAIFPEWNRGLLDL